MFRKKFSSTREIDDLLNDSCEEDEMLFKLRNFKDIELIALPPERVDSTSDCEDIDEDVQVISDLNCALPSQIKGEIEIVCELGDDNIEEEEEEASTSTTLQPAKVTWSKDRSYDFSKTPVDISLEKYRKLYEKLGALNPLQLFELFIDDEVVQLITNSTNKYANVDRNDPTFQTDSDEIRKFIGIMFITGYHTLPRIRHYWSESPTLGCMLIKSTMTRDRFARIKSYFHVCANDTIDRNDKFAKVTPLNDLMNERFLQFGVFAHNLSIDERMIAHSSRHSCNMFIKGKPVRFGFKYWCLCSSEGYLYAFIPYGGATEEDGDDHGHGENIVLRLLSHIENKKQHTVTFDDSFTSYRLLCCLSSLGVFATGKVRDSRTGKPNLLEAKELRKKGLGASDLSFDILNEVLAVRFNDNSIVTVLTNHLKHEPMHRVRRFKNERAIIIEMPHPIFEYNRTMSGVDLFDTSLQNYRIRIRDKKWYWPLITNALDAAMVNAWKLHCLCRKFEKKEIMGQLDFRVFVSECLLKISRLPVEKRHNLSEMTPVRFDRVDHNIRRGIRRSRCRQCHNQTVFVCNKCAIPLHPKCFSDYHTSTME